MRSDTVTQSALGKQILSRAAKMQSGKNIATLSAKRYGQLCEGETHMRHKKGDAEKRVVFFSPHDSQCCPMRL